MVFIWQSLNTTEEVLQRCTHLYWKERDNECASAVLWRPSRHAVCTINTGYHSTHYGIGAIKNAFACWLPASINLLCSVSLAFLDSTGDCDHQIHFHYKWYTYVNDVPWLMSESSSSLKVSNTCTQSWALVPATCIMFAFNPHVQYLHSWS